MKKISFTESLNHAVNGITYALKTERNIKIHFIATICVLITCLWMDIDRTDLMMIIMAISIVIITEILNTAVESIVNLLSLSSHPLAKIAKDLSAGAVLIATINALACGYLVILPAIKRPIVMDVVTKIKEHYLHIIITVIILILIVIAVFKALDGKGTFTRGGIVSGHSALAFGASTAILVITNNIIAGTLAFAIALLVSQSRVEANFHKLKETIIGALIGILLTLLIFSFIIK